jgi:hypothetical protein
VFSKSEPGDRRGLIALKVFHTVWWFLVEAAVLYLLVAGLRGRSDRRAAFAGAVVAGESVIFLANGGRCPLTGLAESLGAESGSVTDIYLPRWLAVSLPAIHVPLVAWVIYLHRKSLLR